MNKYTIITVVAIVGYTTWYNNFQSSTLTNVESQSDISNTIKKYECFKNDLKNELFFFRTEKIYF